MFVVLSVHSPKPEWENALIESMHRYGAAARTQKGLIDVNTLKDEKSGELVGLAIWEDEQSYLNARPVLMEATKNDDFDLWEEGPIHGHRLKPV